MALVAAWLLDEGSGTTAAEYGGTTALDLILSNVSLGANGIDFSAAANDDARIDSADNADIKVSASFTLAMRITTDSSSVSYQQFFHATDDTTAYAGFNLITNSSGTLEFMYGDSDGTSSSDRRSFLGPALSASTTYDICVVVTDVSGSATGVTIYVDTVDETSSTSGAGGAMVYTTDDTTVGNWDTFGTSRSSEHTVRFIALYDHAFSTTEVDDIASDYEAFITGGALSVIPSAIASAEAFGTAAISTGSVLLSPSGIASAEAFGSPSINPTYTIAPSGIASSETFGNPSALPGSVGIAVDGIASSEAFGEAVIGTNAVLVLPSAIASAEAFGSTQLDVGGVFILPSGISTGEAFGTAALLSGAVILPLSIETLEAFGNPALTPGVVYIIPSGIESSEMFGVAQVGDVVIAGEYTVVKKLTGRIAQKLTMKVGE